MVKYVNKLGLKGKVRLLDETKEIESSMYLNVPVDGAGEVNRAMVVNALNDDPDDTLREIFQDHEFIQSYRD